MFSKSSSAIPVFFCFFMFMFIICSCPGQPPDDGLAPPAATAPEKPVDPPPPPPPPGLFYKGKIKDPRTLLGVCDIVCSSDGKSVYVNTSTNASITWFDVSADGALEYQDMIQNYDLIEESISLCISPDDKHVYASSRSRNCVSWYTRNSVTGDLTASGSLNIAKHPSQSTFITISPDGLFVYVGYGQPDSAIICLARDPDSGVLTKKSCYSDPRIVKNPQSLQIAPDGNFLYAASSAADTITWFARNKVTGEFTYKGHLCDQSVLDGVRSISLSKDGKNIYSAAFKGDTLGVFSRDAVTGDIILAESFPEHTLLARAYYTAVSSDDKYVFAVGRDAHSILGYERDPDTGKLTRTIEIADDLNIKDTRCIAVSPDNRSIYVTALNTHTIAWYNHVRPVAGK